MKQMKDRIEQYTILKARWEKGKEWLTNERLRFEKVVEIPMEQLWKSMTPEEQAVAETEDDNVKYIKENMGGKIEI